MLSQNVCGTFLYQKGEIQKPDKFENHCGDGTLSFPKLSSYFFLINCRKQNKTKQNLRTSMICNSGHTCYGKHCTKSAV